MSREATMLQGRREVRLLRLSLVRPAMTTSVGPVRPALEVADILREHGEAFLAKHGGRLTRAQGAA